MFLYDFQLFKAIGFGEGRLPFFGGIDRPFSSKIVLLLFLIFNGILVVVLFYSFRERKEGRGDKD